jgi:hypothetical protein
MKQPDNTTRSARSVPTRRTRIIVVAGSILAFLLVVELTLQSSGAIGQDGCEKGEPY